MKPLRELTKVRSLFDVSFVTEGANGKHFSIYKSADMGAIPANTSLNNGGDSNMGEPKDNPKNDNPKIIIPTQDEIKKMTDDQIKFEAVKAAGHLGDGYIHIEKLGTYDEACERFDEIKKDLEAGRHITSDQIKEVREGSMSWDDFVDVKKRQVQPTIPGTQPQPTAPPVNIPTDDPTLTAITKLANGMDVIVQRLNTVEQSIGTMKGAATSEPPRPQGDPSGTSFTDSVLKTYDSKKASGRVNPIVALKESFTEAVPK